MNPKLLPAFPRPSNTFNWVLSGMGYPSWSMSCRNSSRYDMAEVQMHFDLQREVKA